MLNVIINPIADNHQDFIGPTYTCSLRRLSNTKPVKKRKGPCPKRKIFREEPQKEVEESKKEDSLSTSLSNGIYLVLICYSISTFPISLLANWGLLSCGNLVALV